PVMQPLSRPAPEKPKTASWPTWRSQPEPDKSRSDRSPVPSALQNTTVSWKSNPSCPPMVDPRADPLVRSPIRLTRSLLHCLFLLPRQPGLVLLRQLPLLGFSWLRGLFRPTFRRNPC